MSPMDCRARLGRLFEGDHAGSSRRTSPVLEIFAGVGGGIEDAAELVELLKGIPASPGEAAQCPQVEPARAAAADADRLGHDLNAFAPGWSFVLALALVEENELQGVEIRCQ